MKAEEDTGYDSLVEEKDLKEAGNEGDEPKTKEVPEVTEKEATMAIASNATEKTIQPNL